MRPDGTVIDQFRRSTNAGAGPDRVVRDIEVCLSEEFSQSLSSVSAAGIGIAGLVDREDGMLHSAPNLEWSSVPLASKLSDQIDVPVTLANDVDAATFGEYRYGAAMDVRNTIVVFLGTGVGTGVITDGHLLEGQDSSAGELGHVPVVEGGRDCHCGYEGCLEAYAGGWAIGKRARERVWSDVDQGKTLCDLAGSREEITARTVSKALEKEDELAEDIMQKTGDVLGSWAVGMVHIFNPDRIVIGGSVSEGFPFLKDRIENSVQEGAFEQFCREFAVVEAQHGDYAVATGAASLAQSSFGTDEEHQ